MSRRHKTVLRGRLWAIARVRAFNRARWRCERCGRPSRLECHHKTPLEDGGAPYDLRNLQALCRQCHIHHHQPPTVDDPPGRAKWKAML